MQAENELVWHNDGHAINLRIEKSNLVVVSTDCPNDEKGLCKIDSVGCVVQWFVNQYGLECNVGVCEPASVVPIAWALVGDTSLGMDSCQMWFIPKEDEFFAAWATSQDSGTN